MRYASAIHPDGNIRVLAMYEFCVKVAEQYRYYHYANTENTII